MCDSYDVYESVIINLFNNICLHIIRSLICWGGMCVMWLLLIIYVCMHIYVFDHYDVLSSIK